MKNKGLFILLGIVAIIVFWAISLKNGLVGLDQNAQSQWGKVQSAYQERFDKIPNLVEIVKGEANFEKSTLDAVISARASASQIKVDPSTLTPEKLKEFQANQGQLSQALGRLMVVSEQYPNLKANESFRKLQDEVSGMENRIKRERDLYNDAVKPYNTKGLKFPGSMLAGLVGFKEKGYFSADAEAQKATRIDMGTGGNTAPPTSTNSNKAPAPAPSNAPTK
jgi:LemA protein